MHHIYLVLCVHLTFPEMCLWGSIVNNVGKKIPLLGTSHLSTNKGTPQFKICVGLLECLSYILHILLLEIVHSETHSNTFASQQEEEVWPKQLYNMLPYFLITCSILQKDNPASFMKSFTPFIQQGQETKLNGLHCRAMTKSSARPLQKIFAKNIIFIQSNMTIQTILHLQCTLASSSGVCKQDADVSV